MFTGDRSADWLFGALYKFGFASSPESKHREDGLTLHDTLITAALRCAPPANKHTREEFIRRRPYLVAELALLTRVRVVIALGRIAFDAFLAVWQEAGHPARKPRPQFGHGSSTTLEGDLLLLGSYHPSQQNTFTGKLTRAMFHRVFRKARKTLG